MPTIDRDVSAQSTDERELHSLLQRWVEGAKKGDIETIKGCYTPDVRAFDAIGALQFKGLGAYLSHWEACIAQMTGEMVFEIHELALQVSGDLALAHFVSRCGCNDADGNLQVGWMRGTVGFGRTADGWRITHEHYSMPLDPATMTVAPDLAP